MLWWDQKDQGIGVGTTLIDAYQKLTQLEIELQAAHARAEKSSPLGEMLRQHLDTAGRIQQNLLEFGDSLAALQRSHIEIAYAKRGQKAQALAEGGIADQLHLVMMEIVGKLQGLLDDDTDHSGLSALNAAIRHMRERGEQWAVEMLASAEAASTEALRALDRLVIAGENAAESLAPGRLQTRSVGV